MKLRFVLLYVMLAGMLVSCGGSNTLFDTAAPENSVMQIYVSGEDGTDVYRLSDDAVEREILDKLKNTAATPTKVTTADVELPAYSFWMGTDDGWGLQMTWSNGYLFNRDGVVYDFDFDFQKLLTQYPFELDDHREERYIACERYLVLDENGWNPSLMKKADEPVPPEGIELDMVRDGEKFHATFTNHSNQDWLFGKPYSVQVQLGGEWYEVPVSPENNWAFESIGYELPAGGDQNKDYSLAMYGALPAGQYRFCIYGLTWEFTLE